LVYTKLCFITTHVSGFAMPLSGGLLNGVPSILFDLLDNPDGGRDAVKLLLLFRYLMIGGDEPVIFRLSGTTDAFSLEKVTTRYHVCNE
jgi:hypothetical protein